ncbi:MAG: glycosyltransferase family 9 protein, partial [Anaerolineae bacterium]|nr:glycosyltransferase family 9 protein [Anaerolineae bacterium]
MRDSLLTASVARIASIPFRLVRRGFVPPRKALILKPCCLSQALLATPLLAALAETYPDAQFDWAISDYARPAVATNVHLSELVDSGKVGLPDATWADVRSFAERLRACDYDTVFIPSRSSVLALVAWLAHIPQRVGLGAGGRGFAHTLVANPPPGEQHAATVYLSLAHALGIETPGYMEFYPSDRARSAMTALLVDQLDWLGDVPLVLVHPGGAHNPLRVDTTRLWPSERFVRLANHVTRAHQATVLILGDAADAERGQAITGMTSANAVDLTGKITLDELGALAEMADLYVGNDTGPTHIAAAVGCPTLAIFGPTNPAISGPYATKGRVITLWRPTEGAFSWEANITAEEAAAAADLLLHGP